MERAPFLARFSHGNAFKLLRHGEPQMSSPPISISHRLFRCRYSNSIDVVASSPFFSCPAARAPRGACSPANKWSQPSRFRPFDRAPFIFVWRVIFSFFAFFFFISFSFFFSAFCCCKLRNYASTGAGSGIHPSKSSLLVNAGNYLYRRGSEKNYVIFEETGPGCLGRFHWQNISIDRFYVLDEKKHQLEAWGEKLSCIVWNYPANSRPCLIVCA